MLNRLWLWWYRDRLVVIRVKLAAGAKLDHIEVDLLTKWSYKTGNPESHQRLVNEIWENICRYNRPSHYGSYSWQVRERYEKGLWASRIRYGR